MVQLARVYRKLEQGSFRITPQRDLVVRTFANHPGEHLSAEDVQRLIQTEARVAVGLATVYRTIELLHQLGILQRINFGDGRSRYELNQEEVHRHHHMVCIRCGQVEEFTEDLLDDLEGRILAEKGFQVVDHELKFYGICRLCGRNGGDTP